MRKLTEEQKDVLKQLQDKSYKDFLSLLLNDIMNYKLQDIARHDLKADGQAVLALLKAEYDGMKKMKTALAVYLNAKN